MLDRGLDPAHCLSDPTEPGRVGLGEVLQAGDPQPCCLRGGEDCHQGPGLKTCPSILRHGLGAVGGCEGGGGRRAGHLHPEGSPQSRGQRP